MLENCIFNLLFEFFKLLVSFILILNVYRKKSMVNCLSGIEGWIDRWIDY